MLPSRKYIVLPPTNSIHPDLSFSSTYINYIKRSLIRLKWLYLDLVLFLIKRSVL